ncbi:hypothetical protein [Rhizobium esperanzae]|uniref:Uncharacterized protein n=1 Tax=Rhizobium esperanzae TaxID=1967781 RepID=A0A7W6W2Y7_9HYPH|nr:hypothetical protein [Rhizobium esperanzae]MBB4233967.1 hypothetical protein [Rhizobium esperanzae]
MMQRTMALTLRQARVWKPQQSGVLQCEFRYFRWVDRGFHSPSAGGGIAGENIGCRKFSFVCAGNGWLHRPMFEISDASTTEEKRT